MVKALAAILYNNIVPVFIAIGLGYILKRRLGIEIKSVSRTIFYALSPCLVFSSLVNSTVSGEEFGDIAVFELLFTLGMALVVWGVGRALQFDRAMESSLLLVTIFVNAGNYGLSINQIAFGETALARAIIYFAVSSLLMNTVGVYLASRGKANTPDALLSVFRLPVVYAVLLAIAVRLINLDVTGWPVFTAVEMVGKGAVPLMILLLGMQLAETPLNQGLKMASLAALTRLAIAPLIAWPLANLLGLAGPSLQACVVEASMPTAVTTAVLAIEFDARPRFVTSVIFLSTLASPISLTLIIALVS